MEQHLLLRDLVVRSNAGAYDRIPSEQQPPRPMSSLLPGRRVSVVDVFSAARLARREQRDNATRKVQRDANLLTSYDKLILRPRFLNDSGRELPYRLDAGELVVKGPRAREQCVFPELAVSWALGDEVEPEGTEGWRVELEVVGQLTDGLASPWSLKRTVSLGRCEMDLHTLATGCTRQSMPLQRFEDSELSEACSFRVETSLAYTQTTMRFGLALNAGVPLRVKMAPDSVRHSRELFLEVKFGAAKVATTVAKAIASVDELAEVTWSHIEPVDGTTAQPLTLKDIVDGDVQLYIRESNRPNRIIGTAKLGIHRYWHASFERLEGADFQEEVMSIDSNLRRASPIGSISGRLRLRGLPRYHQMIGGTRNEDGVLDSTPLIFGTPLPLGQSSASRIRSVEGSPRVVLLTDSFGYKFWHNFDTNSNVWNTDGQRPAINERMNGTLYGAGWSTNWIHPRARRVNVPGSISSSRAAQGNSERVDTVEPETSARDEATRRAIELRAGALLDGSRPSLTNANGCATEMFWTNLSIAGPQEYHVAGPKTEGHTLAVVDNGSRVLKFGGGNGNQRFNSIHSLDTDSLLWTSVNAVGSCPRGRTGHGVSVLSDSTKMIIFGGATCSGRLNDLHVYDTTRRSWFEVTPTDNGDEVPHPRARVGMTSSTATESFWVFGGREGYRYLGHSYFNDLYEFDTTRLQWIPVTPRTDSRPPRRSGCAFHMINNRQLFLFGGYEDGHTYHGDTWLFDTVSYEWVRPPYGDLLAPSGREGHTSTLISGAVVVYGGESEKGGYLNDVHVFDVETLRWAGQPALNGFSPGSRTGCASAALDDDRIVVVGGDQGYRFTNDTLLLEVAYAEVSALQSIFDRTKERGTDSDECIVCLSATVSSVFVWCGHSVCCLQCARKLKNCPVCRKYVSKVHSLFE